MTATASSMVLGQNKASERLLAAVALSFLLHVALLLGIPVNPTGGVPGINSVITARLERAAEEQPAAQTTPEASVPVGQEKSSVPDPLAEPAGKKPETKPETRPPAAAPPSTPSSGVEIPLARDPTYYLVKELDVIPRPLAIIQPQCPAGASNDRVAGGAGARAAHQ